MFRRASKFLVVIVTVFLFIVVSTAPSFAAKATQSSSVKTVQSALNKEGYTVAVDGKMGKQTKTALKQFQKAKGLKVTGKIDSPTKAKLGIK
jgi:peptidoglycan hydrolase-like protein with peptidoglycan-binding domain